jgi:uncharacterized membrane protein YhaH (DUF805 family)
MNWYLQGLRKYAVFSGRARRQEYWMFELINTLVLLALFVLAVFLGKAGFEYFISLPLVYILATTIPSLAKLVRRLHDTNHSGWWIFISMVPLIGPLILFSFTVKDGDRGDNSFGPDPKALPLVAATSKMGYLAPPLQ